ncbi:MAG: hypothetical protein RL745_973 [Actinomycetota bacterium]|jgi:hypothetical protein
MMKAKPMKGMIPAGYADGGKVKPFSGKDTKAEEMAEARAVRSGKVSAKQYVARETAEEKKEGEKSSRAELIKKGKALASGKMSAEEYGSMAKMANGGKVKMADGGDPAQAQYDQMSAMTKPMAAQGMMGQMGSAMGSLNQQAAYGGMAQALGGIRPGMAASMGAAPAPRVAVPRARFNKMAEFADGGPVHNAPMGCGPGYVADWNRQSMKK